MKDLLSSRRLLLGWRLLDRDELPAAERVAALDGVRRLLASAGQDLESLLRHAAAGYEAAERDRLERERALRPPTEAERFEAAMGREEARNARRDAPGLSDIGDIFSSARTRRAGGRRDPAADRVAEERWSKLRKVAGADVPTVVTGGVVRSERMTLRGATMLSFRIENPIVIYGPIFASDMTAIETIEAAERHSARIKVSTLRHRDRPDIPLVERVGIAE